MGEGRADLEEPVRDGEQVSKGEREGGSESEHVCRRACASEHVLVCNTARVTTCTNVRKSR